MKVACKAIPLCLFTPSVIRGISKFLNELLSQRVESCRRSKDPHKRMINLIVLILCFFFSKEKKTFLEGSNEENFREVDSKDTFSMIINMFIQPSITDSFLKLKLQGKFEKVLVTKMFDRARLMVSYKMGLRD